MAGFAKYHAKRTLTADGITHASKREAERWMTLKLLERAGEISKLQRQVKYLLIPAQNGERKCEYVADFVYQDRDGNTVVEDCKGYRTDVYRLKRKLMLWIHNIRIKET